MSWMAIKENGRVKFSIRHGSPVPKDKAQEIGEYIDELGKSTEITPLALVKDAQCESSKLHEFFEWDDRKAAYAHRLQQARKIINHFEIEVVDLREEKETTVKAWVSVYPSPQQEDDQNGEDQNRAYVDIVRAMNAPDLRQQVLDTALSRIKRWRREYKMYSEFKPVFAGIDDVEKALGKN